MLKIGVTFGKLDKMAPYDAAIRAAGLDPVYISSLDPHSIDGLGGLLLTGGSDINPHLYGEEVNGAEDIDDERDALEADRLKQALAADLPILAICRGVQFLNVAHGGTLIQHLPSVNAHDCRIPQWEPGRQTPAHQVDIAPGSLLSSVVGASRIDVNSRHHQAANKVGSGLLVSAVSPDGVIEALERPDRSFVLGVQWHPEDRILVSDADAKLFRAFARAVSGVAQAA